MTSYAVHLVTRYDGLVIATFPDLPGVSALGRDDEEALAEAKGALAAALEACAADGEAPPEPRTQGPTMIEIEAIIPLAAV
jgi:predicted RNase H-like HicB family nuclease